jgi:hypothetical protein
MYWFSCYRNQVRLFAFLAIAAALIAILVLRDDQAAGNDLPFLLIAFLLWCGLVVIVSFILLKRKSTAT